jgi:hypothetical protein
MKKTIIKTAFLWLVGGLFATTAVFAQVEGNPENWCRNGLFPSESTDYKIARVKGLSAGEKAYFYDQADNCPAAQTCRLKAYLVPDDEVIVSRTYGNFACVWYEPKKGAETVGWIPSKNLDYRAVDSNPAAAGWIGEWKYYDNSISIAAGKNAGSFDLTGSALWRGLGDNVHVGDFEESAKADGNLLKIGEGENDEDGCRVSLRRVGRFLIVSDNMRCGGVNVSFSGVYRKTAPRKQVVKRR